MEQNGEWLIKSIYNVLEKILNNLEERQYLVKSIVYRL